MTWVEWVAARQLLAEEQLGIHVRRRADEEAGEFARAVAKAPRG